MLFKSFPDHWQDFSVPLNFHHYFSLHSMEPFQFSLFRLNSTLLYFPGPLILFDVRGFLIKILKSFDTFSTD